jgi:hypothetical protein
VVKLLREYIRSLLMEVPLDDFEYIAKDDEDVMVREEVADYFKAIPQSVNIYVAHTDDLSWAHRLPNEVQGKVSGFKSRGQVGLTDIANVGKIYPQIQKAMNPEGINLLYIYPKSFEVPAGADTFVADVNPHYLAHDLHHMLESTKGLGSKDKDAFTSLIKEYLMELVWLSHGGGSVEAEQVRDTIKRTGRRLGVADANHLMSELFPGVKLPSGDFDLFGDIFADYLKNDGNLVLGVPEQLDYDGVVIELNPDSKHDQRAQQYEKKFKDLFDTVLDPLKGKVALFNIFEVESRETERAKKQAEEKMQADHAPLLDHIKSMGGEFKYFDESHQEEGVEELIFGTGLKSEKGAGDLEQFTAQFPKEVEGIESLGYKITSAFDGFGRDPVEIRVQKATTNESMIRSYIRTLLVEGVEFIELDSPLAYTRASNIKRLALCDTSISEPVKGRDFGFNDDQEWDHYGTSGRRLKKPRKGRLNPGVSDVCIIGFLDYHNRGTTSGGKEMWYIDYMKTRSDKGGQKIASQLIDQFYSTIAQPGDHVHFGKMMRKEIGHLKDKMVKQHPDITTIGAKNF